MAEFEAVQAKRRFWSTFKKAWLRPVLAWLCVLVLVAAFGFFANQKPKNTIFVDPETLSSHELKQLHDTVVGLGVQQFFRADLTQISEAVLALSWVDKVSVYRDWQQGIVVRATPKKAVANFGSEHLLDVSGAVFVPANQAHINNPSLVQLYGKPDDALAIMQKIHKLNQWFTPLGLAVQDIIVTPRQTWLVRFNQGLRVMVDYERSDEKLYTLSQLLVDGRLPIAVEEIAVVDLRYKNGFSITKKS